MVKGGLVLCTDSYTIQDVVLLVNVLIIRYGLVCRLRHIKGPRIYILKASMPKLCSIVQEHMDRSMLYKLGQ